jgi:uncharacterized protein YPO0396
MTNPQRLVILAAFIAIAVSAARAEDQDRKARQSGEYYLALGRTHNMQAQDHARLLRKYAALSDRAPADVVQDHVAAIRYNTDAAGKSFARLGESAGDNAALAKHVEQLQKRLDQVNTSLKQLQAELGGRTVGAKAVAGRTNEISRQLRENHNDLRAMDGEFYDSDSDSYYATGEGHFVD